jgi:fatty-acyl-CoA synthase
VVDTGDAPAPSLEDLAEHVRQSLARYKAPRELVVAPIHRAANGKLDYKAVRAEALKALGVQA